ncbi:sphingomyelin phosphodiesterase 3, neutral membrane (neutral sphingomyelinase II), partial [Perkinsus olseni]
GDWAELSVESLAQYGITTDQAIPSCPKRLDYLWVKTGVASPVEEGVAVAGNRPTAEGCLSSTSASSSSSSQEVIRRAGSLEAHLDGYASITGF